MRELSLEYYPNCAQFTSDQMTAYATAAVEADRATRSQHVPQALIEALRFYAHQYHFGSDPSDTEDGSVAVAALRGLPLGWSREDVCAADLAPIEGEADFALAPVARVPMAEAQIGMAMISVDDPLQWGGLSGNSSNSKNTLVQFVRAVEAHHGITSNTGSAS